MFEGNVWRVSQAHGANEKVSIKNKMSNIQRPCGNAHGIKKCGLKDLKMKVHVVRINLDDKLIPSARMPIARRVLNRTEKHGFAEHKLVTF